MKINKMSNEQIKAKILDFDYGQLHTYKNKEDQEVKKQGGSHKNSKYYNHLVSKLERRTKKCASSV